jgi:hypothetical protein
LPIDYKKYPANWKFISRNVIKDAGNCCELCYAPNGEIVYRHKEKDWPHPWTETVAFGGKKTKIVLTLHHIDGDKTNNSKLNLIALCQKDHLRLDLARHIKNRKTNKQDKAQTKLLEE